jgi:Ca2+-binding EF-hand superfamily protein
MTAHKSAPAGLTGEMLRSLAAYASAPPTVCCCLFAIAVRADVPDIEKLGKAFVSMDTNGNGKITRAELSAAVNRSRWWWDPEVDVWSLVTTADLDHSGGLNYTEFVAACLYADHSSLEELVCASFKALDSDRDGLVRLSDIRDLFRERDFAVLNRLPQDRPFNLAEWQRTVMNSFPVPVRNILPGKESSVQEVLGGLAMCKKPPRYHSDDDMNFQFSGVNRPRDGRGRGANPNYLMASDEIPQCEILMESVDHPQCGSWQSDLWEALGIRRWFPES